MQNARDDNTESWSQKELAAVVELLGLTYEVEHLTEDGYFSIDIALPNQRIALEFDGPSHFTNDGANTKSAKTELRDLLLQKRGWRVVSVPYLLSSGSSSTRRPKRAALSWRACGVLTLRGWGWLRRGEGLRGSEGPPQVSAGLSRGVGEGGGGLPKPATTGAQAGPVGPGG